MACQKMSPMHVTLKAGVNLANQIILNLLRYMYDHIFRGPRQSGCKILNKLSVTDVSYKMFINWSFRAIAKENLFSYNLILFS